MNSKMKTNAIVLAPSASVEDVERITADNQRRRRETAAKKRAEKKAGSETPKPRPELSRL